MAGSGQAALRMQGHVRRESLNRRREWPVIRIKGSSEPKLNTHSLERQASQAKEPKSAQILQCGTASGLYSSLGSHMSLRRWFNIWPLPRKSHKHLFILTV